MGGPPPMGPPPGPPPGSPGAMVPPHPGTVAPPPTTAQAAAPATPSNPIAPPPRSSPSQRVVTAPSPTVGSQPSPPPPVASPSTVGALGSAPTGLAPAAPSAMTACPTCAFENPPGFAFCGRCGTRLSAVPQPVAEVGSAQTIFVGSSKDLALGDTAEGSILPPEPAPSQPRHVIEDAPTVEAAPLGVAAPVVSSSTAPGNQPVPAPGPLENGVPVRLVMLGPDGQPIGERVLAAGELLEVGREAGPPWDDDAYLDPRHATLRAVESGIHIDDRGSLNGIFVKLSGRIEIHNGDQFRVGQELLVYEELPEPTPTDDGTERMGSPNPGYWGRVSVLVDPNMASGAYPIAGEGIGIGRENGDVTFPHDGYVSGRHCRIVGDDSGIYLEDLGSSNGTYMRARTGQVVPFGSLVLIGQKLFQLERA